MAQTEPRHAYEPTLPSDANDPPRFGSPTETVKDLFCLELKKFLESSQQTSARVVEIPTIEKYSTYSDGSDPYATVTKVTQKFPNSLEALPHIAVTAASGRGRWASIGSPIAAVVQDPPRVTTIAGPFALADGDTLHIKLNLAGTYVTEILTFEASRFPTATPIEEATAAEVARVINEQSKRLRAFAQDDDTVVIHGNTDENPISVEVLSTSSSNALTAFGLGHSGTLLGVNASASPTVTVTADEGAFTSADVGQYLILSGTDRAHRNDGRFLITAVNAGSNTATYTAKYGATEDATSASWFVGKYDDHLNPLRPPMRRYTMKWDISVNIELLNTDENTRNELCDLVASFFTFFAESKFFTFWGRSGFTGHEDIEGEHLQFMFTAPLRSGAESEVARPNDGTEKIYINSFSQDGLLVMELDRLAKWDFGADGDDSPVILGYDHLEISTVEIT